MRLESDCRVSMKLFDLEYICKTLLGTEILKFKDFVSSSIQQPYYGNSSKWKFNFIFGRSNGAFQPDL